MKKDIVISIITGLSSWKIVMIVISSMLFLTSCGLFRPKRMLGAYSVKQEEKKEGFPEAYASAS